MSGTKTQILLRNRFKVLERLGAGGGGTVYQVEDLFAKGRLLALKVVFIEGEDQRFLETLKHEFHILAVLRHPLIARVYDFGRLPAGTDLSPSGHEGYFFTRDLIEGHDLNAYCRGLDVEAICRVCQRTAEVLHVLHQAGMVHGDFKPANVIVSEDGNPHLIDFGLVRHEGESIGSSGTIPYMAPEVLESGAEDRRADIYSLGITLYRLLSGRVPRSLSVEEMARWHRCRAPLQLSGDRNDWPDRLELIIQRLTEPDADRRFPTAAEAALALAEVGAGVRPDYSKPDTAPSAQMPGQSLAAPLRELESIAQARLLDGAHGAGVMAVEGEIGAGKSRLLQELGWRCQLRGIEVIRADFRSGDLRTYGPWEEILTQVAGLVSTPHPLEQLPSRDTDPFGLFQRIRDYLVQAAPLLLVLDNAELSDPETRALLRFLRHTLGKEAVLVVVTYRPDGRLLPSLGNPARVTLASLSVGEVRRMLELATGRTDQHELARELHTLTGGNPLYLTEVMEQMAAEGWPASPDLSRRLPPLGLEELFTRNFGQLESSARTVLELVAIIGRPVGGLLLGQLLAEGLGGETRKELADSPALRDWLERDPNGTYHFQRGHDARMVYQQILPRRRQALHWTVTEVLERVGVNDPVERTRHAIGAARPDMARKTVPDAVARLRRLGALRAAIELLEGLVALLGQEPAEAHRLRCDAGELYLALGDCQSAQKTLMLAQLGASKPLRHRAQTLLARAQRLTGEAEQSLDGLERILDDDPEPTIRIGALVERAEAHQALDANEAAVDTARQALVELDRLPAADLMTRAQLQGQLALSLGALRRFDAAERTWVQALADARASGDPQVEASIHNRWAITAYTKGDMGQVAERYEAAQDCAKRAGDVERTATIRFNWGNLHLHLGELAAALRLMPECVLLFEAMGMQRALAASRASLGHLQRELGLHEQAGATLELAMETAREVGGGRSIEAYLLSNRGLLMGTRGDLTQARDDLTRSAELFLDLEQPMAAADSLLDLAMVELDCGETGSVGDRLLKVRRAAGGPLRPDLEVRHTLVEALLSAQIGDLGTMPVRLREAVVKAERAGFCRLAWRCHAAAMDLASAEGQKELARHHAGAARAILERMAEDLPPEVRVAFWQDKRRMAVREHQRERSRPSAAELEALEQLAQEPDTIADTTLPPFTSVTVMDSKRFKQKKD